jgi:hypothetical protein
MENYSDIFKLNPVNIKLLNFNKFKDIRRGEMISIGIHPFNKKYLNTEYYGIVVYSIETNRQVYLDATDTVKLYNQPIAKLFSITLFFCSLLSFVYFNKLNKLYY